VAQGFDLRPRQGEPATLLATHLTELLKGNMAELLSYGEVQKLLKELPGSSRN
jgi:flagellar biosynthesis protein FlhA